MKYFNEQELDHLKKMNIDLNEESKSQMLKICCNYKLDLLCSKEHSAIVEEFEVVTNIENKLVDGIKKECK